MDQIPLIYLQNPVFNREKAISMICICQKIKLRKEHVIPVLVLISFRRYIRIDCGAEKLRIIPIPISDRTAKTA